MTLGEVLSSLPPGALVDDGADPMPPAELIASIQMGGVDNTLTLPAAYHPGQYGAAGVIHVYGRGMLAVTLPAQ